jgi:hypothetical protein
MEKRDSPPTNTPNVSRKTIRLTVRSSESGIEFLSAERLDMITPPQPGERPQAGQHGGWWFELRNGKGRVLAHRIVDASLLESVEVHSPNGRIERQFGEVRPGVFEVLLPDMDEARSVVLVGSPLRTSVAARASEASRDIASFDLSPRRPGSAR